MQLHLYLVFLWLSSDQQWISIYGLHRKSQSRHSVNLVINAVHTRQDVCTCVAGVLIFDMIAHSNILVPRYIWNNCMVSTGLYRPACVHNGFAQTLCLGLLSRSASYTFRISWNYNLCNRVFCAKNRPKQPYWLPATSSLHRLECEGTTIVKCTTTASSSSTLHHINFGF